MLYLEVVSAAAADEDTIPDIKGVDHEEVDDGLQQILQRVTEAEAESQHQGGASQPGPVQIHLHGIQMHLSRK